MDNIKELAKQICNVTVETPAKCGGSHEICLHCKKCRAEETDQLATDFEDIAKYIDHTILKAEATKRDVKKLCEEANDLGFASVCANPTFTELMSFQLDEPKVCTVIGFPLGANTQAVKVFETRNAIENGAQEIDVVLKISKMITKKYSEIYNELEEIANVCIKKEVCSKLILETCLLNTTGKIAACLLAKKAGINFVKTSTGMNSGGATIEDVKLMRDVVGPKIGVKASGGIRDRETAIAMLKAGANRIGASKGLEIINQ